MTFPITLALCAGVLAYIGVNGKAQGWVWLAALYVIAATLTAAL